MATSGTVGTTRFTTQKVLDLAYGRCRIARQEITGERITTGLELLFLRLSAMANKGIPLWAVQKEILPLYLGKQSVPTPIGTVNVLNLNLRRPTRVSGTASASEGTAENAFDGDFSTACTQVAANGYIQLALDSAAFVPMFGLLPNASGTWNYTLQGSDDGIAWTTFYTATAQAVVAGEWLWFDVEGMAEWSYLRLQATGGTILNVTELVFANTATEVMLAPLNRDDYSNLPNKNFQSQPTQYWFDRQRTQPVITLWPSPGEIARLWNLVAYVHRQIEDVGTMAQELEVRQSAYLAIVARVAGDIAMVDKEVRPELVPTIIAEADREWRDMWDGESDDAPTTLTPNIRPYTR